MTQVTTAVATANSGAVAAKKTKKLRESRILFIPKI